MDTRSAELTKYAANAMLATKISFMNELSNLADKLGADIEKVRVGIGSDSRIGYQFIYPGPGFGGSCFPKDIRALRHTAEQSGYQSRMVEAVEAVNNEQKQVVFKKIMKHYNNDIAGKTFALWGLAFKPDTDDMRESPSRVLMEALWKEGAIVKAFDPHAQNEAKRLYPDQIGKELILCTEQYEGLKDADALIIITEAKEYRSPETDQIKNLLKEPVVFDGRNLYEPKEMGKKGFRYYSIGRPVFDENGKQRDVR